MVEPADKIKRNKDIAAAAAAYSRLPLTERTKAKAKIIFDYFNTNNNGTSKLSLDNLDDIDEQFKKVMGFSPLKDSFTEEEFYQNIDLWANGLAKYKAPVMPKKAPFEKVDETQARTLANNLVKAMAPNGQTSETGVHVAENSFGYFVGAGAATGTGIGAAVTSWSGGWGALIGVVVGAVVGGIQYACSDSDKDRYEKAYNYFGSGDDMINEKNIVEVMRYVNPEVLNRVIDTLDEGDDNTIRQNIAQAFEARIAVLKEKKVITDEAKLNELSLMVTNLETNTDFKENLIGLRSALLGVGVQKE